MSIVAIILLVSMLLYKEVTDVHLPLGCWHFKFDAEVADVLSTLFHYQIHEYTLGKLIAMSHYI